MNRSLLHAMPALLIIGAITNGCTPVVLPTREANVLEGRIQVTTDRFGVCWPFDFDRSVPANHVAPATPGEEFVAGYTNHIRPGQSCNTQESFAFSGAFAVNLDGIQNVVVTNATLTLDRRATSVPINVTHSTGAQNFCILDVEMATEAWHHVTGDSIASRAIPGVARHTIVQDPTITSATVDVTGAVQQWALNRLPNFGFVVKPRTSDIGKNENRCTGYWSNPRLDITIAERTP
jgi:hypothetical protein